MAGSCCPSARQLLRRGAARRRARAHSVDGWTTVYDQDGRPRAMPDELVGAPANRCCALLRQHDEPPYTHCSHKNARRATRASHTHYRHTTSATRRPAREKRTAHFKFVCDRAPSNCAEPGSRRGRRHGLQLDGDGAASRRRYGGGRVYMELTIDGRALRPAQRGSLHKGPPSRVRVAIQRLVLETQSRPETIHAQVQRGVLPPRILGFWEAISHT